eukprot:Tamp_12007.p1 GENE.Tamp_12007~~Tamp_12007.p1  ORF type:complete len:384 (+),score=26.99 Tamp_12007:395-1546(+)
MLPRVRFRQHRANEMAHYAADCWDAEVRTSAYGWIEVVGHADRASFDLDMHSKATGIPLVAWSEFDAPVVTKKVEAVLNRAAIGKTFRADAPKIVQALEDLASHDPQQALAAQASTEGQVHVHAGGKDVSVTCGQDAIVHFREVESTIHGTNFMPRVIEPSFGIDRLLYCTLENAFYVRPSDEQRTVLGIPASLAPYKTCVTGISSNPQLVSTVAQLYREMCGKGVRCRIDDSTANIGRRYARIDEIGVPYIVTVDFESATDHCVTLRERDSCQQIRVPIRDIVGLVASLTREASDQFPPPPTGRACCRAYGFGSIELMKWRTMLLIAGMLRCGRARTAGSKLLGTLTEHLSIWTCTARLLAYRSLLGPSSTRLSSLRRWKQC